MSIWSPKLSSDVVRVLRGEKSKSQLSQKLGYSPNQVYLWESGKRHFFWADFEELCEALRIPLRHHIKIYLDFEPEKEILEILNESISAYQKKEIAHQLNVSSSKLSRWLQGNSKIPFHNTCQILEFCHQNFCEFLDEVSGVGKLDSIQDIVLEKRVGISEEEEKLGLRILEESGQIYWHNGLFKLKHFRVKTTDNKAAVYDICQYWCDRAASLTKYPGMKSLIGYRVFAINEKSYKKIRAAQIEYYQKIGRILNEDEGPYDYVVAMNFHAMVLNEEFKIKNEMNIDT